MSLIARRAIFYAILILFFIVAPLIIFYTAGYRYNFKQNRIFKTGAIILESDPDGASIYLNGRLRPEKTPARLENITPGEYDVQINKDLYHPWQKKLTVESEKATIVNNLILFKDVQPKQITNGDIIDCLVNQRDDKIILYLKKDNGLYELWQKNGEENKLFWSGDLPGSPRLFEWAAKTGDVIIGDKNSFFFINLLTKKPTLINIRDITKKEWTKIEYNQTQNILLGLSRNNLYNLDTSSWQTDLLAQNVTDFATNGNTIIFIQNAGKGALLKTIKNYEETIIMRLPTEALRYQIRENTSRWIALADDTNNLRLISDGQEKIIIPGNQAVWTTEENPRLITHSDFEIWQYNPSNGSKTLLTRLSDKIMTIIPHPSNNGYLAVIDNAVKAYEFDLRDRQNIYNLAAFEKIYHLQINKTGKTLYVAGIKNKEPGLWSLEIR